MKLSKIEINSIFIKTLSLMLVMIDCSWTDNCGDEATFLLCSFSKFLTNYLFVLALIERKNIQNFCSKLKTNRLCVGRFSYNDIVFQIFHHLLKKI